MTTICTKIACIALLGLAAIASLHANNAPLLQFIPLEKVLFDTGKAVLKADIKASLDDVAKYLRNNLALQRVIIEGHTDEVGQHNRNYRLSDQRAAAVRDYLIGKGVPAELIQLSGHGENHPVDEPWSRAGRERNRQVEIFAVMRE